MHGDGCDVERSVADRVAADRQIRPAESDYELSMGVAQAQWVRDTVYDVITYNTPYTANGFDLPAQDSSHVDSVYLVNGGIYNYDLWRTLYLIVCPQYMEENNPEYDVLAVSGYCWTKQNLRKAADGAVTYQSPMGTNVPEVYGLLYPQTAAQTLCPDGWHLPMVEEVAALSTNPAITLRSTEGWVNGDINTNSTDFTAYPAGFYNANTQRFEGLGSETYWWMTGDVTTDGTASGVVVDYFCDTPRLTQVNANDDGWNGIRCRGGLFLRHPASDPSQRQRQIERAVRKRERMARIVSS